MIAYTYNGTGWVPAQLRRWASGSWAPLGEAPNPDVPLVVPTARTATIGGLRPTGRVLATYTVSPTDTSADYTTIGAAIDAAKAAQQSAGKQSSISWNSDQKDMGPDYRVDIVIGPGVYDEVVGTASWINFYGASGDPNDVVITSNTTGEGTVRTWGPGYFEGLTIRATEPPAGVPGQKYPLHLTSGHHTTIFTDCKMVTTASAASGAGSAIGMDGAGGSYTLFYGCVIQAVEGTDWATNLHGEAANTAPLELVFVNCTSNGQVVYDTLASGQEDRVNWVGGSTKALTVKGTTAVTTVDPGATTGTVTAANLVSGTSWPLAEGGTSARDRGFYYPSKIGTPHDQKPVVTDAAPMTVTADRVYYVPVPITEAIHATSAGVEVTTAAGALNTYRQVERGGTAPTPLFVDPAGTTLTTGVVVEDFFHYKDFHPGTGRVWVRLRFSAAAQVMGSVELPGAVPCYYEDQPATSASYTPNLVRAPAGAAFPLAILRSKS